MRRTSMPAAGSEPLRTHDPVSLKLGPYIYGARHRGNGVEYSVSDGQQTVALPMGWAFGDGSVGQSYLYERKGGFEEVRFSYYRGLGAFARTPFHSIQPVARLENALGRPLTEEETVKCFACHTTAAITKEGFNPKRLIEGVTCESCHGPGADHVAAMKSGLDVGTGLILNPARLSPVASVDFCGACHRTWWDVKEMGKVGVFNVRFPPSRLVMSRCWGKGDARLTCAACHDAHKPVVRGAAAYDAACLNCHVKGAGAKTDPAHPGPACPKATKECSSCHMPKYEVDEVHFQYTDHMIRVVKPGEAFPE